MGNNPGRIPIKNEGNVPANYENPAHPSAVMDVIAKTRGAHRASRLCAVIAIGIGTAGLAGWILQIDALKRIHPALVTMKANTAVALMLAGFSLLLLQEESVRGWRRGLGQAFAGVIALLGLLTLGENLFGWDIGIDQFLFQESAADAGLSFPGRMGVASTLVFFSLGMALMLFDTRLAGRYWGGTFSLIGLAATFLVFLYYFYGIVQYEPIAKYATIALHTAVAFCCLCAGIVLARPERGIMIALAGESAGSVVARRMLPMALFLPVVLGALRTLGRKSGWFGPGFGTALLVLGIIVVFSALIWGTVRAINREEAVRMQAQEALARSEAELRDFVENASVGLHWVGPEGKILWANQTQLDLLGHRKEDYIGHSIAEFHADAAVIEDILQRLRKAETLNGYEARLRHKDGSIRHVIINSNARIEEGKFIHSRCFTRDITEQKKAEEVQARLAAIVTSSSDAIVSKTLEGIITTWNPSAERIFGYTAAEIVGQPVLRLIPPERHAEEAYILGQLKAGNPVEHYETVRLMKNGQLLPVSLTISPVRDAHGTIIGASKVIHDITERKQSEQKLREANELLRSHASQLEQQVKERTAALRETVEQLETFSYSIVHDMRAPLRSMRSFALILEQDYGEKLDDTARAYLTRIMASASRMDALITDVLAYSRVSMMRIQWQEVDLDALVLELLEQYPQFQEAGSAIRVAHPLPVVKGNKALLTQVFSNLLNNALKFIAPGQKPRVLVRPETNEKRARVWVEDAGIGIPAKEREKVFGLFERLNPPEQYSGTGVGLTIVKKAVERMGGTVGFESEPGKGSRFWFELEKAEPGS